MCMNLFIAHFSMHVNTKGYFSVHFGGRITEERKRLGMTQAEMAMACGVSRGMWGKYEKDKASMGSDVLARFASCGADVSFVVTGNRIKRDGPSFEERLERLKAASEYAAMVGETDEDKLRIQEEYMAMGELRILPCHKQRKGIDLNSDECIEPVASLEVPSVFACGWLEKFGHPGDMALFQYDKANMQPEIQPGDILLYDRSKTEAATRGLYLLIFDSTVFLQKVTRREDMLVLTDIEPGSNATVVEFGHEGLKLLGRVVWWSRTIRSIYERPFK